MKSKISQLTLDACAARDRAWQHAKVCDQCEAAWIGRNGKFCVTGALLVDEFFDLQKLAQNKNENRNPQTRK